jgi:hypothetical protein
MKTKGSDGVPKGLPFGESSASTQKEKRDRRTTGANNGR